MLGGEKQQQCLEWFCSQDSKPGLFNETTQASKTLSSYSRVVCSLQCNSKSRGEWEKVIVGFNKGLADERKHWVAIKDHSQTCQQNNMWSQVQFNKCRSRDMVLLEQAVAAWTCQKSTIFHQLLLNVLMLDFSGGNTTSSAYISDFQTKQNKKTPTNPKISSEGHLTNRVACEFVVSSPSSLCRKPSFILKPLVNSTPVL